MGGRRCIRHIPTHPAMTRKNAKARRNPYDDVGGEATLGVVLPPPPPSRAAPIPQLLTSPAACHANPTYTKAQLRANPYLAVGVEATLEPIPGLG